MDENDSPTVKQGTLEDDLGRLTEKPCKQERQLAAKGSHSFDLKRAVLGLKRSRPEVRDGGESRPKSSVFYAAGREDQCLGLVAEAFADELDLLRQDEHFRGSDRDVAAMADMMRSHPMTPLGTRNIPKISKVKSPYHNRIDDLTKARTSIPTSVFVPRDNYYYVCTNTLPTVRHRDLRTTFFV